MRKTAEVEVLIEEDAMEFAPGDRVQVWYASEGRWKEATVRAVIMEPAPSMRVYYQVRCEGRENPRYYSAEELQALK
jgi:hypothetical protein